ncbi:hypothetical protein M404DRAFT_33705 [Pisolithus tinctorius Marx 270]|uniref:Uncharacterized protein n=1 Tax=Pisolithus tinctorius Marx 270 TaxID=870435 RepID=A0A0C3IG31_PISTI|nr:hypothetical protein M404DRAFT_33705 [Pisolithus tinctorius Marx 270]
MSSTTPSIYPPMPPAAPPAAAVPPAHSVLTLPLLSMKSAPELLQGDHTHVHTFLDHYEQLCAFHHVNSDQELVKSILQYCNVWVREIIEGMAHYYAPNCANLKADLLKYFNADLSDERFIERHLKSFTLESSLQPIPSLQDFRAYNHGFIHIGGWLKNKGRILVDEHNHHFWAGLSPVFCSLVESHLRLKDLNLDTSKPFPYEDVCQSAKEVLCHDHFDADDLDFLGPRAAPNAPQAQNSTPHHSDDIKEETSAEIYELEGEPLITAVDHSTKITKEKRMAAFDSVLIPPHSHGTEKENHMPKPLSSASIPAPQKAPLVPVFIPVDVHAHAFDGTRDDAIMEDDSSLKLLEQAPDSAEMPKKLKPAATTSLSSSLSQSASSKAIVDWILSTPLTVSVGEVIGTSWDVPQHLQELKQFKRQPLMQQPIRSVTAVNGTPPVASYLALTSSPLITINLSCNGQQVTGVIDSGPTLNVIQSGIAQFVICMPINMSQSVNM